MNEMQVIGRKCLDEGMKKYAEARSSLKSWFAEAQKARWKRFQDIKNHYSSASYIGDDLVIFNIKGTKFRLVVRVDYKLSIVMIEWFGPHAEYSKKKF